MGPRKCEPNQTLRTKKDLQSFLSRFMLIESLRHDRLDGVARIIA